MAQVWTFLLVLWTTLLDHVASDTCNYTNCLSSCCGPSHDQYCCDPPLDGGTIGGIIIGCLLGMAFLMTTIIVCCCFQRRKTSADRALQPHTIPWFTTATATATTNNIQMTTNELTTGLYPPPYQPNAPIAGEYPRYEYSNPSRNLAQDAKQYDAPPPSYEQAVKSYEIHE